MAIVTAKPMTAAEFAALDIDVPVELVRGEIIDVPRPGVPHGIVCANVVYLFRRWAEASGSLLVVCNNSGVLTESDPDTVRGPDVFLFESSGEQNSSIPDGFLLTGPLLAVEVLSPWDRWQALISKIDEYFTAGTQEVWVIDPELRQLHQHRTVPPPVTLCEDDVVSSPLLPGFVEPLPEFFRGLPAIS